MIIITSDEERCSDLEIMLTKLNEIKEECYSKDIDNLIFNYISEYEYLNKKLKEEYEKEKQAKNAEYEKSVWAN